ncbi:sugar-binding protein [Actinomadura craniellae]|uniref:Sugar-binding protein n=1 Tax=Actinomadura craniellae TaxID=2231787 RepID=A0A365H5F3_9ACTN|nr:RHS repeat-associated core domain-containing protein [Actinomadura craniellae]RAY14232.1 sugar-binding protein [Actinomadura craniellae]
MVAIAVGVGLMTAPPAQAAQAPRPEFTEAAPVDGKNLKARPRKPGDAALTTDPLPAPRWPAPGTAEATVPAAGKRARAGTLPVWVTAPTRGDARTAARPAAGRVRVSMLDRQATRRAGVQGVLFTVGRSDAAEPGQVAVGLDYAPFATAFGGSFGSRLRLVQYPACVLTTPEQARCRTATPLPTANDGKLKTLTAQVQAGPTPAGGAEAGSLSAPTAGMTVLAAEAGGSGPQGDYKATSLSPSSTWNTGLNTGQFNWSYPMRVPPAPGGLAPGVALRYSSGSVDGRTSNTNSQSSWVGEGFELWPGFIERRYRPCEDDGVPKDPVYNASPGDMCWGYDNATLSWNGKSGELVPAGGNVWRLKDDDGTRIEKLTGSAADTGNGDNDNEYWRVTTTDGTQFYFGKNRLPGYGAATQKVETRSAWTVPVFGDDGGSNPEPCHQAAFKDSWCKQAWRWNLDYAVDPNGNAITYFYEPEVNHYGRNLRPEDETEYQRGGTLQRIEYGLRSDKLYDVKAPARVLFTSGERCLPTETFDCDPDEVNGNQGHWQDVPWDLACSAGQECKDFNGTVSPTFWTRKRLISVKTQVIRSDGSDWRDVDSWALGHKWGLADSDRSLLPTYIQHTGHAASAGPITLPKVTFDYEERDNRVQRDNFGRFMRYRLDYIADESGGQIDVTYSTPQCTAGSLPEPHTNTKRCYPVYWTYDDVDPELDWFHKYVVTQVVASDRTGLSPQRVTRYVYDDQAGAAWHYDDDDGLTREKYKTWSQWRGYGHVNVLTGGTGGMVTQTDHHFLRGMHGDRASPSGGSKTVTVDNGDGGTVTDHDALAGFELRTVQRNGVDGPVANWTQNLPVRHQTASRTRSWGTVTANIVKTEYARTFTNLNPGWRKTEVRTDYDASTGRTHWVFDNGNTADSGDDRCTRYTYADNTTAWLRSHVARQETTRGSCGWTGLDRRIHVLADVRTYYDGSTTWQAPPTRGRVTYTERLVSHAAADGSEPTYQKVSAVHEFDDYGRPQKTEDARGRISTTVHTQSPATPGVGLTTKLVATTPPTNPDVPASAHTITAQFDAAWGLQTVKIDAGGQRTEQFYDALGRSTRVWLPDRNRLAGQSPSLEHTYQVAEGQIVAVGTRTVTNSGSMTPPTYQLLDGFLRPRQTQEPGPNGGRVITDSFYDARNQVDFSYSDYYNDQAPPTPALFGPEMQGLVKSQTDFTYDALGRKTREALRGGAGDVSEVFATTYAYGSLPTGNWVSADPPDGGTPTTTYTDARGRTRELRHYNAASPTGTDFTATTYEYDPADRLISVTGPGDKIWTFTYDVRGRKTRTVDPDRGTTVYDYDQLDQLVSVTDARYTEGDKTKGRVFYAYDPLGRRTHSYASNAAGEPGAALTVMTYDALRKGQLDSTTARGIGPDGQPHDYTTVVNTYDALNRPTRTTIRIPGAEGALAGDYQYETVFNPDGTVKSTGLPAAGGLPAEVLSRSYDALQQPVGLTGSSSYVTGTSYTNIGQLRGLVLSAGGPDIDLGFDYDLPTGRLTHATATREGVAGYTRDATYSYTDSGNITRISDVRGGVPDTQCFRYDHQQRLTDAWSQTSGTCPSDPQAVPVIGGPDPYRVTYTYDASGNRKTEHQYGPTGTVSATRTYKYLGDGGLHASVKGHMLGAVAQTGTSPITGVLQGDAAEAYEYDAVGNMTKRGVGGRTQNFTWSPDGEITRIQDTAEGDITFVYGANGDRLIRREASATTLYLPGMELLLDKPAQATPQPTPTATRYYSHAGQDVALRTSDGVTFLVGDHQGTSQLTINANDLDEISQRRYTPFGQTRGTLTGVWPLEMDKGFVGGTKDTTGLTHLGAREYDPNTGRFISVDPVFDYEDPQQMNGYGYANNSPVANMDEDGLLCRRFDGHVECSNGDRVNRTPNDKNGYDVRDRNGNITHSTGMGRGRDRLVGGSDIVVPDGIDVNLFRAEFWRIYLSANRGKGPALSHATQVGRDLYAARAACAKIDECRKNIWFSQLVSDWMDSIGGIAVAGGGLGAGLRAFPKRRGRQGCRGNSFVPGTVVLMADGSRKPIEDVKVGDKVVATDPQTGKTGVHAVSAIITGVGQKTLIDIFVYTDSGRGDQTGLVIATDEHAFWVAGGIKRWVKAADLEPGMWLRTSLGARVQVAATHARTVLFQRVHNLTIAGVHTYYVEAGDALVLVHNDDPLPTQKKGKNQPLTNRQATHLANYLGYRDTGKIIKGQKIFTNGKTFISQDVGDGDGSHNGGTWKIAKSIKALGSKATRTATTDALLNEIGC